mmetsp:Transcript_21176/g.29466  ORF Transcript_21176/g.29466 Transcript_21176/m.29466 type:complete len:82 (-) Transcript_21176:1115-1360(-)
MLAAISAKIVLHSTKIKTLSISHKHAFSSMDLNATGAHSGVFNSVFLVWRLSRAHHCLYKGHTNRLESWSVQNMHCFQMTT